jgi:hypothetical protein
MRPERRRKRSTHRFHAAELYLEAVRRRSGAKAVALASDEGLVVSGSGPPETLAILGVLGATPARDLAVEIGRKDPIHTTKLELSGSRFYLTSLGGKAIPAAEARTAFERILFS